MIHAELVAASVADLSIMRGSDHLGEDVVASEVPYMTSAKNLTAIFAKIKGAGTPPKFTNEFLKANLGFPSSNDRTVIRVLKALGFLSANSVPTPRYNEFREGGKSGRAMVAGLREGWSSVLLGDQRAYERSPAQLAELFKNVTGAGEAVATKMATTFKGLASLASASDWTDAMASDTQQKEQEVEPTTAEMGTIRLSDRGQLSLHHDVHVHLPATSDVSVYTAIFRALRTELLD